jgi:hypothetical protein
MKQRMNMGAYSLWSSGASETTTKQYHHHGNSLEISQSSCVAVNLICLSPQTVQYSTEAVLEAAPKQDLNLQIDSSLTVPSCFSLVPLLSLKRRRK